MAGTGLWLAGETARDWRWSALLVVAVCGMQLRLLCNLFDGMVAIEGGFKTKSGEFFNELPDRFSDAFIFIGDGVIRAGLLPARGELGWAAAVLAMITAYVRALGASMGAGQHFIGPMAKQQRMALMTAACLIGALAPVWAQLQYVIPAALALVVVGCFGHYFSALPANRGSNGTEAMMKSLFVAVARFICGVRARWVGCAPDARQRVYFANHTSNLDALVVWASLPPFVLNLATRPVAAARLLDEEPVAPLSGPRRFQRGPHRAQTTHRPGQSADGHMLGAGGTLLR